jgi:general stress protein 26
MTNELKKFYALIEDVEIAMMTTRRHDGHLRARRWQIRNRPTGADLWFVTAEGTAKIERSCPRFSYQLVLFQKEQHGMDLSVRNGDDYARPR